MGSFPVAGQVEVQGRQATLALTLPDPTPEAEVNMCRPTTENIEAKIDAGTMKVHPTRQPITKKMITNAMGNVHRMLLLPGVASGGWNPRAQVRLEALLAKPILSKIAKPLAIEDKKDKTEFKDAKVLAIEDKKSTVEEKVAKSSSSDSSSSSSDSEDNSMQVSPLKTELQEKDAELTKAKEDFESIFSALHACQAQLHQAEEKIKDKDMQIALLQQQNAEMQAKSESDDEMMTSD